MLADPLTLWHGFGPETKAALIGALSSICVAAIGIIGLISQLRKQGDQNRENVAEVERRRIKAQMYGEAERICAEFSYISGEFTAKMISSGQEILMTARAYASEASYPEPSARLMTLTELRTNLESAVINVIFLVENRRFIEPNIVVFRSALSSAMHDLQRNFVETYFDLALKSMPMPNPDGGMFEYVPPTIDEAELLWNRTLEIVEYNHELSSYVEDFMIELQNFLVGDLFGKIVPYRQPINPDFKVIRIGDAENLERHFLNETNWGHKMKQNEEHARKQFQNRS